MVPTRGGGENQPDDSTEASYRFDYLHLVLLAPYSLIDSSNSRLEHALVDGTLIEWDEMQWPWSRKEMVIAWQQKTESGETIF
jgi:hypothetical protein